MFKTTNDFYKSKVWEETRKRLYYERLNENGELICQRCYKPIILKYDAILHHCKEELTVSNMNDYSISLNPDNLIWLHHKCHNDEHCRFSGESNRKVYLVYGSPLSGKSSWVESVASKDDLICDIDSIYEMISINPRYIKNDRLKTNVFQIRNCIYDMIKTRTGKFCNAYIIGGFPMPMERKRLTDQLGAETVFVDCSKEECIKRLYDDESRKFVREEWVGYIDEWFDKYQPDELVE